MYDLGSIGQHGHQTLARLRRQIIAQRGAEARATYFEFQHGGFQRHFESSGA
jgi:hypothetical protein